MIIIMSLFAYSHKGLPVFASQIFLTTQTVHMSTYSDTADQKSRVYKGRQYSLLSVSTKSTREAVSQYFLTSSSKSVAINHKNTIPIPYLFLRLYNFPESGLQQCVHTLQHKVQKGYIKCSTFRLGMTFTDVTYGYCIYSMTTRVGE